MKKKTLWLMLSALFLMIAFFCAGWYVIRPGSRSDPGDVPAADVEAVSMENVIVPPPVHTVTFHSFVGGLDGERSVQAEHDAVLSYTPETYGKYPFEGWYLKPDYSVPYLPGETVITSDTDIWAKFLTPTAETENLNAPVVYIDTEHKIDKEKYTGCTVIVEYNDRKYGYRELSAQIRGRGNSTWNFDKKPYRLKFDNKIDLFGMGKARDWVLLANTMDRTLLRNLTVYRMAQHFDGLKNTTDCEFAHVYINNDYRGLYLFVEQVEEGDNRVEIGDGLDPLGNLCAPEETGFLLECGKGGDSNDGQRMFRPMAFTGIETDHVVIKSPDPENLTDAHVAYIKDYFEDVQRAIAGDDFDTLCELVDIQSFVDSFICVMYILSGDMGYDYFVYKEPGGKLFMGPLWDYDQSSASSEHGGSNYKGWEAANPHPWYVKLIRNEQFRQLVVDSWMDHYDIIHGIPDMLYGIAEQYRADIDLNYTRWEGFLTSKQWRTPIEITRMPEYSQHVDHLVKWLNNRVAWIEEELGIPQEESQ